ncbi:hypothetical protein AN477_07540 [Alicyclobacillus ferrooxydans]|uniref:Uncharacterized protein n=1 Tax=Alicyclobacillus ferrooxydans TaxID=471514 RepID=A0A0P9EZC5_9BACL|nr:hypothetical protein AN477_07540 [Alicyclobacillus ferrooxydans]
MVNESLSSMRHHKRIERKALALAVCLLGGLSVTACSPVSALHQLSPSSGTTTGVKSSGNGTGAKLGTVNTAANPRQLANEPGNVAPTFDGVPVGGTTFDPQGLFDFYDDSIYVTEAGNTLYVSWESYAHGDEVYTSIAQGGQWVVQDKPVYSLAPFAKDGDWSRYLAGNELAVVNNLQDTSFMVKWNSSGNLATQQTLYNGWIGGDFPISDDGGWAVTLHLPYGAPTGGARYSLFLPSNPAHPQVITTSASQFTGALYAFDTGSSRLYEVQTTPAGAHVLDVYTVGGAGSQSRAGGNGAVSSQTQSGSNGIGGSGVNSTASQVTANSSTGQSAGTTNAVPVNTQLVTDSSGQPLQQKLSAAPDILEVSPQGTVYTLTQNQQGVITVTAYDKNLNQVSVWNNIKLANPYAQNVQMSVTSGVPKIYDVVNYQGETALQQITLK